VAIMAATYGRYGLLSGAARCRSRRVRCRRSWRCGGSAARAPNTATPPREPRCQQGAAVRRVALAAERAWINCAYQKYRT